MESIERAIRNAFAKSDAHNPVTRQRIYEAAWGAHERALTANAALSEDQKQQRRQKIKAAISEIEAEFKSGSAANAKREPSLDAPESSDPVLGEGVRSWSCARYSRYSRNLEKKKRGSADLGYEAGVSRKDRKKSVARRLSASVSR